MNGKYIIIDHIIPVLVSPILAHKDVRYEPTRRPTSAGFFRLVVKDGHLCTRVCGGSVSLKLESHPDDAALIDQLLDIGSYSEVTMRSEAEQSVDRLVICNMSVDVCHEKCPHKYRHAKIHDYYSFDEQGQPDGKLCTDLESDCGWPPNEELRCKCK